MEHLLYLFGPIRYFKLVCISFCFCVDILLSNVGDQISAFLRILVGTK